MSEVITFHLDENVNGAIAEGLRRRSIDVTTAAIDSEHVAFALRQDRVIFTHDADFLRLHQQGVEHAGIVYSRPGRRSIGEIVRTLIRIWESQTPSSMYRHLEFI